MAPYYFKVLDNLLIQYKYLQIIRLHTQGDYDVEYRAVIVVLTASVKMYYCAYAIGI